jgi:DNA-binding HxlR family transcriptional regulator
VRRTRFDEAPCPIARVSDLVGDWWTPIVLRDLMLGVRRFEDLQEHLDISRATLAQRLDRMVAEGLLVKVPYQERPVRHEYRLTDKGRAFWDVLAAMWRFGEDWLFADEPLGPPVQLVDRDTRRVVRPVVVDENTGERLDLARMRVRRRERAGAPAPSAPGGA